MTRNHQHKCVDLMYFEDEDTFYNRTPVFFPGDSAELIFGGMTLDAVGGKYEPVTRKQGSCETIKSELSFVEKEPESF